MANAPITTSITFARPVHVTGRAALCWLGAALLLLAGCSLHRGPGAGAGTSARGFRPIERPKPAAPATAMATPAASSSEAPTSPTTPRAALSPSEIARPGNPAAWGDGARMAVGRQFEPIYFDADSDELDVNARQHLQEYAQWLREHPDVWITLAGHTDRLGAVPFDYNLAMARAMAVADYLVGQGLPPKRLFAIGFGGDLPAAEGKPEEVKQLNNRVELLAFISPLGQLEPDPIPLEKNPPPGPQAEPAPGEAHDIAP